MEPYRTPARRCPSCPEMPMREFHHRLICDECHGMMIGHADLATACSDLVTREITLAFSDEKPTTIACPHCERAMTSCEVTFTPLDVAASVLRCERHGLWFDGGLLTAVFARLNRKTTGVMASPPDRLLVSARRHRPKRRDKPLLPTDAYRGQPLACPICAGAELTFFGDRYACSTCTGTFVQNAAFEAMASDIAKRPFELPPPTGSAGPRACPICAESMLVEPVEGVPIDRCATHGIWFDANELTIALEQVSGQFDDGWRAWLKKVFS